MAFLVPLAQPDALTPRRTLAASVAPGQRVLRRADMAALADAQAMLASAGAQADAILAGAQAACEAERQRGYADGLAQAQMEQIEKMIDTSSRTIEYFAKMENDMVQLVMSAVRKIVSDFDDTQRVLIVVKNALSVVRNQKQMTLRLPPREVEVVRARINDLLAAYPGVGYLDIVPDGRLAPQSCILESEIGLVEASIEGQIAALETAFKKVLGSRV